MQTLEKKKEKLHQLVDNLPPERLDAAAALLEQVWHEGRVNVKQGNRIVRLGGLWKDLGIEITEEDIAEARRELWGTDQLWSPPPGRRGCTNPPDNGAREGAGNA